MMLKLFTTCLLFLCSLNLVIGQDDEPQYFQTVQIHHSKKDKSFEFVIGKAVKIKSHSNEIKGTIKAIRSDALVISMHKTPDEEVIMPYHNMKFIRPLNDNKATRYFGLSFRILGTIAYASGGLVSLVAFWDWLSPQRLTSVGITIFGIGLDRLGNWMWGRRFNVNRKWEIGPINP